MLENTWGAKVGGTIRYGSVTHPLLLFLRKDSPARALSLMSKLSGEVYKWMRRCEFEGCSFPYAYTMAPKTGKENSHIKIRKLSRAGS